MSDEERAQPEANAGGPPTEVDLYATLPGGEPEPQARESAPALEAARYAGLRLELRFLRVYSAVVTVIAMLIIGAGIIYSLYQSS